MMAKYAEDRISTASSEWAMEAGRAVPTLTVAAVVTRAALGNEAPPGTSGVHHDSAAALYVGALTPPGSAVEQAVAAVIHLLSLHRSPVCALLPSPRPPYQDSSNTRTYAVGAFFLGSVGFSLRAGHRLKPTLLGISHLNCVAFIIYNKYIIVDIDEILLLVNRL